MEEGIIFSEKVAVRLAEGVTPVAVCLGEVLMTLGGVVSVGGSVVPGTLRHCGNRGLRYWSRP
jgi:hypothetical protein